MSSQTDPNTLQQALKNLIDAAQRVKSAAAQVAQMGGPARPPRGETQSLTPHEVGGPNAIAVSLTPGQHLICERVINVFETGSIQGNYSAISIFEDGPHDIRQITYGRSQTTEYGNLRELVQLYVEAGGRFSDDLREFVDRIGRTALVDNARFKELLRRAGAEDPVMRERQDVFFDRRYFQPALSWADVNGFSRALSILVIYDSFIHSGSILPLLRSRFPEVPPASGGDEQTWVRQYVDVRHQWLLTHPRPSVRASAYRTRDLAREIARGNWDLAVLPIFANGVPVDDSASGTHVADIAGPPPDVVPYFGEPAPSAEVPEYGESEIWSDDTYAYRGLAEAATVDSIADPAALAARILGHPGITLATTHASGHNDQATARQNIVDTSAGRQASRSSYSTAPGGHVALNLRLLRGLLALADRYTFAVSELVGGSHNPNSRHYVGVAADINIINGRGVNAAHPGVAAFKALCRSLGATEVLGPGAPHHDTHVHTAWPRP